MIRKTVDGWSKGLSENNGEWLKEINRIRGWGNLTEQTARDPDGRTLTRSQFIVGIKDPTISEMKQKQPWIEYEGENPWFDPERKDDTGK